MPSSFGTTSFKPVASKILRAVKDEPSEHVTENSARYWANLGHTARAKGDGLVLLKLAPCCGV